MSPLKWCKVDSHVEEKRRAGKEEIKGNPLAWRLNEAVDTLAGLERDNMTQPNEDVFFPSSDVMLEVQHSLVYSHPGPLVREAILGPALIAYQLAKNGWD